MGCGCGAGGRRNVLPPPMLARASPDKVMPMLMGSDGKPVVAQPTVQEHNRHIERLRRDKILKHLGKPLML